MAAETQIISAISNVGFPIAAFVLMYRFARDTVKENTEAIKELRTEITRIDANNND